jgi:hypothetical protein
MDVDRAPAGHAPDAGRGGRWPRVRATALGWAAGFVVGWIGALVAVAVVGGAVDIDRAGVAVPFLAAAVAGIGGGTAQRRVQEAVSGDTLTGTATSQLGTVTQLRFRMNTRIDASTGQQRPSVSDDCVAMPGFVGSLPSDFFK